MLKSFAKLDGSRTYTFPSSPGDQTFTTNFKNLVQQSSRIPGADGGVRQYGIGRSPSPYGSIQVTLYLVSSTPAGMQAKRDALNEIVDWGVGILYDTLNGVDRWAVCSISDLTLTENRDKHTDLFQEARLSFDVPEPYWLTQGNQALWDGSNDWDSAIDWDGGSFTTITGSGTLAVTTSGSASTHARFVAKVSGAQTFNQLLIQRLANNAIADEVILQTQMVQNDVIEIDPRRQWVLLNGNDKIANCDVLFPDWLRLLPAVSNSINILLDEASAAIDANVYYYDRYT